MITVIVSNILIDYIYITHRGTHTCFLPQISGIGLSGRTYLSSTTSSASASVELSWLKGGRAQLAKMVGYPRGSRYRMVVSYKLGRPLESGFRAPLRGGVGLIQCRFRVDYYESQNGCFLQMGVLSSAR